MRPWTSLATTTSLTASPDALSLALDLDGRELDHAQLARERPPHGRLELVRLRGREKPDAAEVDAEHRDAAAGHLLQRAQHRAVAAEHDHEVGAAASASGGSSSTPASAARRATRSLASAAARRDISATRRTLRRSGDGIAQQR